MVLEREITRFAQDTKSLWLRVSQATFLEASKQKNKIEFRFARAKKEDVESLLADLDMTSWSVKDKADIESYGLENPTPSIDYKENYGPFEDIKKICRRWLEV